MKSGTIAFLLGALVFQQLADLPSPSVFALVGAIVCLLVTRLWRIRAWRPRLWLVLAFVAGCTRAALTAYDFVANQPEPFWFGGETELVGTIVDLPQSGERAQRFMFRVVRMSKKDRRLERPLLLRLSWYNRQIVLHPGQQWQLTVRLRPPRGFANPGSFDYEGWLYQQGIHGTGYVRERATNRLVGGDPLDRPLDSARWWLKEQIQRLVPIGNGSLLALILGLRDGIEREEWAVLQATGTNHLIAISGLHIGLVFSLAYFICRRLWGWWPIGSRRLPAQQAATLCGLLAAVVYAALAGFTVPTQRALVMVAAISWGLLGRRPVVPGHSLALAALAVLIYDPTAVLSTGFWLSFAAVALLLWGPRAHGGSSMRGLLLQWRLSLGLLPFLLYWFQQASMSAPLANLVAIPWVGFIVVPLALTGTLLLLLSPPAGAGLLGLAAGSWDILWWLLVKLADGLPVAGTAAPNAVTVLFATAGILWLLLPRGWPLRSLGVVALIPLLAQQPERPAPGQAWLTMLDVGQGLAVVVQTRAHTLVFDTGPRFNDEFDASVAVILPFLRQRGITHIDNVVVSHGDNDHIGGLDSLLQVIPVEQLITNVQLTPGGFATAPCRAGYNWSWDGVRFTVIHPGPEGPSKANNGSCVVRIDGEGLSALLTADIEKPAERHLLTHDVQLAADLLVAPHHGSKTSSSRPFIEAVGPRLILIPAGYRNRWHFPSAPVVETYRDLAIPWLSSAVDGAVEVRADNHGGLRTIRYRERRKRYWHRDYP